MSSPRSRSQRKAAFLALASKCYDELEDWYDAHPEARFGEIETQARQQRRKLMGEGLRILVNQRDTGYQLHPPACQQCQGPLEFVDYRTWTVRGLEGDTPLKRAYYVCPQCEGQTFFPPGRQAEIAGRPLE